MSVLFNDPANPNQLNPNLVVLQSLMSEYDNILSMYQQASQSYLGSLRSTNSSLGNSSLVDLNSQLMTINNKIIALLNSSSPDFQSQVLKRQSMNQILKSEYQKLINEQSKVNETIDNYISENEKISDTGYVITQNYIIFIFLSIVIFFLISYLFYLWSKSPSSSTGLENILSNL